MPFFYWLLQLIQFSIWLFAQWCTWLLTAPTTHLYTFFVFLRTACSLSNQNNYTMVENEWRKAKANQWLMINKWKLLPKNTLNWLRFFFMSREKYIENNRNRFYRCATLFSLIMNGTTNLILRKTVFPRLSVVIKLVLKDFRLKIRTVVVVTWICTSPPNIHDVIGRKYLMLISHERSCPIEKNNTRDL